MAYPMRAPCRYCGHEFGVITPRGGQQCVFCESCGRLAYNAPKTETGEALRTVTTLHNGIRPKQRMRVLAACSLRCVICGANGENVILHVGHLLSVADGLALGLTETEINADANLAAFCEECNLGLGQESIAPRLLAAIVLRHVRGS